MKKQLPFLSFYIALITNVISVVSIHLKPDFINANGDVISYSVPAPVLTTLICLFILLAIFIWNERYWRIGYAVFLIAALFPQIDFMSTTLRYGIGSVSFDALAMGLLIFHLVLNPQWKGYLKKSEKSIEKEKVRSQTAFKDKTTKFETQFQNKSTAELQNIVNSPKGTFAKEAVQAAQNLLSKKS